MPFPLPDPIFAAAQDPALMEQLAQELGRLMPAPPPMVLQSSQNPPQQSLGQLLGPPTLAPGAPTPLQPPEAQANPFAFLAEPQAAAPAAAQATDPKEAALAALLSTVGDAPQPPALQQVDPNFRGRATNFGSVGNANPAQNQISQLYQGFQPSALGPSLGQLLALSQGS